ncbi:MAG: radical SAM protein [Crenarchaeota archaeon]|nr:radical SAM protein [Thermoproteota archaeon]
MVRAVVVDVLARLSGRRPATIDVIGAGPRTVASVLEWSGVRADVYPYEAVEAGLVDLSDYDYLFASAMSCDEEAAVRLAAEWRRRSGGPAVIGGPITASRKLPRGYDYAVYGEAELVLPRLVEALRRGVEPADIPGIVYRGGDGCLIDTGHPGYTTRMHLSRPYTASITGYPLYWASRVYVEAVRGCSNYNRPHMKLPDGRQCIHCPICFDPSTPRKARLRCPAGIPPGCGYCSVPALYGPPRSRPPDVIAEEVKRLIDMGATRIVLSAPDLLDYYREDLVAPDPLTTPCTPPANTEALEKLLAGIYDAVPEFAEKGPPYLLIENVKACLVDEEVARILGEYMPGTPVHIGVETGDPDHYMMLGRPGTPEDAVKAVELLKRHGLKPYLYFIYGLPGETPRTARRTVKLMKKLYRQGAEKVTAYRFRPLPGSAFEKARPRLTRYSRMIKHAAEEINKEAKKRLIGRIVEAIVAGYHRAEQSMIAYTLPHGPVLLVRDAEASDLGWLIEAWITGLHGERMMEARLARRIKPLAHPRSLQAARIIYQVP